MKRKPFVGFLIVLVALALAAGLIQPLRLTTTKIEIKDSDVPAEFVGKKIAFLADIHYGYYLSEGRLEKLVERVNGLNADMIVLGGDFIDRKPHDHQDVFSQLKSLRAPLGVYAVLGNHDYTKGREYALTVIEEAGLKSINNQAYWLGVGDSRIRLGGIGDLWKDDQDASATVEGVTPNDFSILVSHNPDYVKEVDHQKMDVVLSGHTHAGQITLFGLWAPWVPSKFGQELRYGLKNIDGTMLYTTSGVGTTFLPLRYFTRPEIAEITLAR